ncbi:MAG TPA: triose-phosphate isomerase [Desulfatiglandales bacterium]|nr:triose-phosphate isomerase [Desulfatiglandales bacterium]
MKDRKPLMAANWKMNLSLGEARELLSAIKEAHIDFGMVDVLVAPPFTTLPLACELLDGTSVFVAGQNMHWEKKGAFTGEISPLMLKEIGCSHVILGHSERRALFFETSELINKKALTAREAGLVPIICIGETLEEREEKRTFAIIETQLNESLKPFLKKRNRGENLILAYEPVWAIGTGKTATPVQAQEVHSYIRDWLVKNLDPGMGDDLRILYGGSVKPDNITELMAQPDIDGALIGGASLKADSFLSIVRYDDK